MTVVTPKVRSARLALLADTSRHTLPGQFPSTIIWVEVLELLSLSCISTTFSIFGRLYSPKNSAFLADCTAPKTPSSNAQTYPNT